MNDVDVNAANSTHGSHSDSPDAVETWSRPNKMV